MAGFQGLLKSDEGQKAMREDGLKVETMRMLWSSPHSWRSIQLMALRAAADAERWADPPTESRGNPRESLEGGSRAQLSRREFLAISGCGVLASTAAAP
jgi:hypothetical protein